MSKNIHITVVGNVGSGKSTLTELLADEMPAIKIPADSLFKTNPFFSLALKDRARWSFTSDLWFLYERVKMARKIPKLIKKGHVVVDSGIPMSLVYTHSRLKSGHFTTNEWNLYEAMFNEFSNKNLNPDLVVYLYGPIELLLSRIKKRGREFEIKHHTQEYLKGLNDSLKDIMQRLHRNGSKIIKVDVTKTDFINNPAQVKKLIAQILESV